MQIPGIINWGQAPAGACPHLTDMINNKNITSILNILQKEIRTFPEPAINKVSHNYHTPFHILVSTLLSARTKDETTIKVCEKLFTQIKNNDDLLNIKLPTLKKIIHPAGFYHTKAKHLKGLADLLKNRFKNIVPQTLEELTLLPGVGRKTANLVMILAFDKYGICVDTHVHRIINRWQYVSSKTPDETEMRLREKLPKRDWKRINDILVSYGKVICKPITPLCKQCHIAKQCPYSKKTTTGH